MRLVIFLAWVVGSISAQTCTNRYPSQDVRASGDWSELPQWNALEPKGLMKFDSTLCAHVVSVGGLRPNTVYKWKVVVGNTWSTNFGCSNNADCSFTSNSNGQVRFIFSNTNNQLSTDFNIQSVDFTVVQTCNDKFSSKVVHAPGEHNFWLVADKSVIMTLDTSICAYVLSVTGLTPNIDVQWKVQIGSSWTESYGCSGGGNCRASTNAAGQVRFLFTADTNVLSFDHEIGQVVVTSPAPTSSQGPTTPTSPTSPAPTTQTITTNPVKPCTGVSCPTCATNNFAAKLIRATGDWSIDAGSTELWAANEPLGLMTYDQRECAYVLTIVNLKTNFNYKWKITIDNSFKENYGCSGMAGPDCAFKSSGAGSIRLIVKPSTNPPQLTNDFNVGDCGNGICEPGQTCKSCPEDCGECPPPVCGDGICEDTESPQTCPQDCPNELPGCDRFNDESCQSGSQINANPGVANRRWQTPKAGQAGYLPGFQDNWALVGYADIRYTSPQRNAADLCIVATHKSPVTLTYHFDGVAQADMCKRFTTSQTTSVSLRVTGSDGTKLDIAAVNFVWNAKALASRPGDFRNGQKGAVPEMFGWPHKDVEKECEIIAKAGYLGVKLFPVHEQLMSHQPFNDAINPWYFMYQPVSYKLDGRMGSREDLISLINTCRSHGLRIYVDAVLNHMTGAGNDLHDHRNPGAGCTKWGNKTSSAPEDRRSPFYTHAYTYKYNIHSGEPPSNEFPGAALGPDDFHCDRSLGSWSDLFILNNGWLVGLTDIHTGKDNVRERQAAYLVEMLSLGVSGFRIDAAKHVSPDDLSAIFKKVQQKMGGQLPDDFFAWLEVLTGGESGLLWSGPAWYGSSFENTLLRDLGSSSEVEKIKMWDGLYPKEPGNNPISKKRVVIQNDDHDQQHPGSSSRDMGPFGCVLVKNCPANDHRNFEVKLFQSPNGVGDNDNNWPIRFILSSYYFTHGANGIPDGKSTCALCTVTCESCREDVPYLPAYVAGECAYAGTGYTRVHRDIRIINAMRSWMKLGSISGGDIGLPNCS